MAGAEKGEAHTTPPGLGTAAAAAAADAAVYDGGTGAFGGRRVLIHPLMHIGGPAADGGPPASPLLSIVPRRDSKAEKPLEPSVP